jgi:hypothetical protein
LTKLRSQSLDSKSLSENQYRLRADHNLPKPTTILESLQQRKSLCNRRKAILIQRVRVLESIKFLTDCVEQQVVPRSIRIKRCHQFINSNVLYDEFDRELCVAILQAKKTYYNEINTFLDKIDNVLDKDMRLPWCNDECDEVRNLTDSLRQKHAIKLVKLQRYYESRILHTTSSTQNVYSSSPLIYNFSERELTDVEINLLLKGHRFIPNQLPNHFQMKCAVHDFIRTVRLAIKHEDSKSSMQRYRIRSQYIPSMLESDDVNDSNIENFLTKLKDTLTKPFDQKPMKCNLHRDTTQALCNLRTDENIIIQSADKGQSFVVLDKKYYSAKVGAMLNEPNYYQRYESKYHCQDTIDKVMKLFRDIRVPNIKRFVQDYDVQTPLFYALPKIHKSKVIAQELITYKPQKHIFRKSNPPDDLPFRPIVASSRGPTQQLARILDAVLRSFLMKVPSYIQSYQDFIKKIWQHRHVPPGMLLCTFDIRDLYTNIDHILAIKAVTHWIAQNPDLTHQSVCKLLMDAGEHHKLFIPDTVVLVDIIACAVRLILDNNIFLFDGVYYKQVKGIAMGSSIAPTIANLTIGYLEIELYKKVQKELGDEIAVYVHEHWYRYIDDCQLLWPFGIERLDRFTDILQTLDKAIIFVREVSHIRLPFLNIMLEIKKGALELDIYYKPTHTFAYLHFQSSHPRYVKRRIPYTLAMMINTIVSNVKVRRRRLYEMRECLRARGYPVHLINDAIKSRKREKHSTKSASECALEPLEQRFLNFRIMYNQKNPDVYSFVYEHLPVALGERRAKKFISRKVNILPPNLKRLLTSNRFYYNSQPPLKRPSKCDRERCSICRKIVSESNDGNIRCNASVDCTSRFVVYQLDCKDCRQFSYGHIHCMKDIKKCSECKGKDFNLYPFHKMNTDRVVPRQLWLEDFLRKRK